MPLTLGMTGAVIFFTSLITVLIAILILRTKHNDLPEDRPIVNNFINPSKYTNGFYEGVVTDSYQGKERITHRFLPRDINIIKAYNNKEYRNTIKEQKITVRRDLAITIPKGIGISAGRSVIFLLPEKITSFPPEILKTEFGQMLAKIVLDRNVEWNFTKSLQAANDRQVQQIKDYAGKEISIQTMQRLQATYSDALKIIGQIKPENKTVPINPTNPGWQGGQH